MMIGLGVGKKGTVFLFFFYLRFIIGQLLAVSASSLSLACLRGSLSKRENTFHVQHPAAPIFMAMAFYSWLSNMQSINRYAAPLWMVADISCRMLLSTSCHLVLLLFPFTTAVTGHPSHPELPWKSHPSQPRTSGMTSVISSNRIQIGLIVSHRYRKK